MRSSPLLALVAAIPSTLAAYKGFNYGALDLNGAVKDTAAFEGEFNSAKTLGFPSARLYTSIQGPSANSPISAFQAAINTGTTILLGIWASNGAAGIDNEIAAIQAAITAHGSSFTDLIAGISVGNEDVYRITSLGVASNAGTGADPATIANYVTKVKAAFPNQKVGHVDTYNVWSNSSGWMSDVITAVDFIGMNAFPYYEDTKPNGVENGNATFWGDWDATVGVAQGKPIYITETGWPTSGPTSGSAVASVANAATYYSEVACHAFGSGINTWWYTLQDSSADAAVPSFGVVGDGTPPPTTPKYDLAC